MSKYVVSQEAANAYLASLCEENEKNAERANNLMSPKYIGCDCEEMTLTIEFPVLPWELNRKGQLHGGIVCTMLDHTVGLTVAALTGYWAPAADFNVAFLRTGKLGTNLVATGKISKLGKRIVFVSGTLNEKDTGNTIATCQATYVNNAE